ncbi:HET-domain-containing protein, partial [Imleria badia]
MASLKGIFLNKKKKKPLESLPTGPIADAFKEYINNEIPARLIHTSKLQFVSRNDVFRLFQDRIVNVTEEQIEERIRSSQRNPFASRQPRHDAVLRQIIQEVIEYDILSHRWDEIAGKPTFQDISSGKQPVSKFEKLAKFCETSRKLGRKLAWVDTCCIDKTNAVELSEAIHGMYKWYANAYLCIVHLAESTSFSDWDRDSWFRRGWTLQELLAPKRVKFYNKNWQPFTLSGTHDDDRKFSSVIPSLSNATGISEGSRSARTYLLGDQSIMSWASRRQTTRVEDKAYCLIGLFRVSFPITYGEGQRAFPRLVEAISEKNPSWDV